MEKYDVLEVNAKYETEGNLAVIYEIDNRILCFYSKDKDPKFKKGQKVSLEETQATSPYKTTRSSMLPSDAFIALDFTWGA